MLAESRLVSAGALEGTGGSAEGLRGEVHVSRLGWRGVGVPLSGPISGAPEGSA